MNDTVETLPTTPTEEPIKSKRNSNRKTKFTQETLPQETINEPIQAPIEDAPKIKQKKVVSEKTLLALKAGREKRDELRKQRMESRQELTEKIAIKKANNILREKLAIKKMMNAEHLSSDEEELMIPIQPKKSKKKQVVYLPPESDSEEEIVYKKTPKQPKKTLETLPKNVIPLPNLVFL